jgi:hypothetical protein
LEHLEALEGPHAGVVDASVVVRALALLDRGLVDEARDLLAGALAAAGPDPFASSDAGGFPRLGDAELESAFDDARPETDAMIDADGIAFEAIRQARLDEPESVSLPAPDSPFHTRTMADLLERQGDLESASAIRSALGADGAPRPAIDAATRARTIQTLERWLARLRGGDA